jgi:hypothetical protein
VDVGRWTLDGRAVVRSCRRGVVGCWPNVIRASVPPCLRGSWVVVRGSWFVIRASVPPWFVGRAPCSVLRAPCSVVRGSWFVGRQPGSTTTRQLDDPERTRRSDVDGIRRRCWEAADEALNVELREIGHGRRDERIQATGRRKNPLSHDELSGGATRRPALNSKGTGFRIDRTHHSDGPNRLTSVLCDLVLSVTWRDHRGGGRR